MSRTSDLLDQINIPSPCTADWDSMIGNDQVRFCEHCSKSVSNISAMTRKQALELVSRSKGRLCVRYYRRPDGKVHTENSQSRLYQLKRRASRIAAGAFSAALGLSAAAQTASAQQPTSSSVEVVVPKDDMPTVKLPRVGATLVGKIIDPDGAAVAGAVLKLINIRTEQEHVATTNSEGEYRFEFMNGEFYRLEINSFGFLPNTVFGIFLRGDAEQRVDRTLQPIDENALAQTGDEKVVPVMSGGAMVAVPDDPLVKAVFDNDLQAVKDLLATGIEVERRDKSIDSTALEEAVQLGNREIVQALLGAGADVNARNNRRQTPIMRLDDDGTARLVEDLVRAGAKVNLKDEDGDTPLILAASYSNAEVVQALVRAGARLETVNKEGRTAFMKAAEYGNLENVKMLFDLGADINRQDKEGETALTKAQDNEYEEVVKFLKDHNAIENYRPEKEEKK